MTQSPATSSSSDLWFDMLFNNPFMGVFEAVWNNDEFVIARCNPCMISMIGLEDTGVIGHPVSTWLSPGDAERFADNLQRVIGLGTSLVFDEILHLPRGRGSWQISATATQDDRVLACVLDFSSQKRLEIALQETERQRRTMVDAVPDLIFRINRDGVVVGLEEGRNCMLPIAPISVLGKKLEEIFDFEVVQDWFTSLNAAATSGHIQHLNFPFQLNGKMHDLEARIAVLNNDEYMAIVRDISTQKELERQLTSAKEAAEEANRSKSSFLANVSHELRTPLNAIIGFSEVIEKEMFGAIGSDRYREYARDINLSGTHLLELINDLLDISKLEAGKMEMKFENFESTATIRAASRLMQDRMSQSALIFRQKLQENVFLNADVRAVKQMVLNLLSNAHKFTPIGGEIVLSSFVNEDGNFVIHIKDSGIGIDPKNIPHILSPFGQVESDMSRKHRGTGLGLSLVKSFAELHGGRIEIESDLGKGTQVSVILPAHRVSVHA